MNQEIAHERSDPATLPAGSGRIWEVGFLAVAAAAGLASAAGAVSNPMQFAFSYLTAFAFVLSLAVGGLFWSMLHHLTGAGWSVVVRRFVEHFARALPWMALLFLPILWGTTRLYAWSDATRCASDPVWLAKRAWFGLPFFWARSAFYLATWAVLGPWLARLSTRQDRTGDPALSLRMRAVSAPGMILLGVTTTFAALDWLMSLDYRWYSSIFGVYFWIQSILGSLAALILVALGLRAGGHLRRTITIEHVHDLGKLLFAFTIFWAYIAFSQYFLIWYANQPEETSWFLQRQAGTWNGLSWFLPIGHFAIPFALLLPRAAKRNPRWLGLVAAWVLAACYLDFYWLVMPTLHAEGARPHWLDLTTLAAVLSLFAALVARACARHPMIPVGDPRLAESLIFRNV
ncbi:MAG: hypothetical protein ACYC61_27635 [Isosphaeraceae bacterium]